MKRQAAALTLAALLTLSWPALGQGRGGTQQAPYNYTNLTGVVKYHGALDVGAKAYLLPGDYPAVTAATLADAEKAASRLDTADQNGRFQIAQLSPGNYRLLLVSTHDNEFWQTIVVLSGSEYDHYEDHQF